ncbi:MAG TPA: rod shape-determining protein MreD [Bacillales bacterium]|nr:rod shape-determining protein MreD [Bacillales bacterium]
MIRPWLPLVTFFFFIFDGTVMQVFSAHWFGADIHLIPRFAMILVLFTAVFYKRSTSLAYGLIFGFMQDIIYTDIIGVYSFTMAFTAYLIASFAALFRKNVFSAFALVLFGVVLLEFQVYGLYSIIGVSNASLHQFLYERLFPSLVLNGGFFICAYYPVRKGFDGIADFSLRDSEKIRSSESMKSK